VIFSFVVDEVGSRRDLTDQLGLESMSAAEGLLLVDRFCCLGHRVRRRRARQFLQTDIFFWGAWTLIDDAGFCGVEACLVCLSHEGGAQRLSRRHRPVFLIDHPLVLVQTSFRHQLASTRYHTFAKTHQTALYPSIITAI
jgi:hypothetical protein